MAVKVISDKPVRMKRVICPTCCYELEFTGEDVITVVDRDGDSFQSIQCPRLECQRKNRDIGGSRISVIWP